MKIQQAVGQQCSGESICRRERRQAAGQGPGEGVISGGAVKASLPATGPERASFVSIMARALLADGRANTAMLKKEPSFLLFGELQRGQSGWKGRVRDGVDGIMGMDLSQRPCSCLQLLRGVR